MLSRFDNFISDINEIDLYWHRIASLAMKPYGLKGNYGLYFTCLSEFPQGLTAAQLAMLCSKDKADVSRDISSLLKAGLVQRESGGYRALISLTEQGGILAQKLVDLVRYAVAEVGREFTAEERTTFYRVLNTITKNMRTLSENGLPQDKQ